MFSYARCLASLAFLAATLSAGDMLANADLFASACCFIFACSAMGTSQGVRSSAKANSGANATAPAIRIEEILLMSGLLWSVLGCATRLKHRCRTAVRED